MTKKQNWFTTHAGAIGLILAGAVLYAVGNHNDGVAMIASGLASFGIKTAAGA